MTTGASIFPYILHRHWRFRLVPRGQETKCLPQLPVLRVCVHQQTRRHGRRGQLLPGGQNTPPRSPIFGSCCWARAHPILSPCCWGHWGPSGCVQRASRGEVQEDRRRSSCFFSRSLVELNLTPHSSHLCPGLHINTTTLNPQAKQGELFLFKGNIKSL